jgi:hypothetical protein
MTDEMRGIRATVYRPADGRDSSNGGITSLHTSLTLIGDEIKADHNPNEQCPAVKLMKNGSYVFAQPLDPVPAGHVGYSFGGNFLHTSDSRFPTRYAIPVHDRFDTEEAADRLSR